MDKRKPTIKEVLPSPPKKKKKEEEEEEEGGGEEVTPKYDCITYLATTPTSVFLAKPRHSMLRQQREVGSNPQGSPTLPELTKTNQLSVYDIELDPY